MRAKIMLITAVVAVITIVITAITLVVKTTSTVNVTVHSSPLQVNLTINDHDYGKVTHDTTLTVRAGKTLTYTASRDGFQPETKQVETSSNTEIYIGLIPQTEEARNLLNDEEDLYEQAKQTEKNIAKADEAHQDYPILSKLPHEEQFFSAYQGPSESSDMPFTIHLYLHKGHEEKGRASFRKWLKQNNYSPDDYKVVEHIDDTEPASFVLKPPPTHDELNAIKPSDITMEKQPKPESDPKALADQFSRLLATWDTTTDKQPADSLDRVTSLMSEEQAKNITKPEKPTLTHNWRRAYKTKAKSHAWNIDLTETDTDGTRKKFTATTCWAWIAENESPHIDGPRTTMLTIDTKTHKIVSYSYDDPSEFVRTDSKTICTSKN